MDFGQLPPQGTLYLLLLTAIVTSVCTLLVTRLGGWLILQMSRPIHAVRDTVWKWIAPRNPFSLATRNYRRHVLRSSLAQIENPIGPIAQISLSEAFAPLRLMSDDRSDTTDLSELLRRELRVIVLGGPGTGKTTLMKHLMLATLHRHVPKPLSDMLPVFVVLRDVAAKRQSVVDAIVDAFAAYHFPGASSFVDSALAQGKLLIIFDGLDEVGASRPFVVAQLQQFAERDAQRRIPNRLVITCRENSYRTQDLRNVVPTVVRVEPFTNRHMWLFLRGWPEHRGRVALALYGELQGIPEIREACRNPLLLSILTGLYLEADQFAIPRSRDRFYSAAIDELLIQRPARRQMQQLFTRDEKLQVLQRVSLEQLESQREGRDVEAIHKDALATHAKNVISREFDVDAFITEVTETNSILKATDDQVYTCPHRTIQEYLAAREARRARDPEAVLKHFASRAELFEVLLFYCGLVGNLPILEQIVAHFAETGDWQRAGECLLNIPEVLSSNIVDDVAAGLNGLVVKSPGDVLATMRSVEVLAALGLRSHRVFDSARRFFGQAVAALASQSGRGSSALGAALMADPDIAMTLVPGLLEHSSEEWQRTAIRILRDLGRDEATDRLVLLLREPVGLVRVEAAVAVAQILKERDEEIRKREKLLPPRAPDARVWPLERYLPGRIALPLIESIPQGRKTGNAAIDVAADIRMWRRNDGRQHPMKRAWTRLPRDLIMYRVLRRVASGFKVASGAVTVVLAAWMIGEGVLCMVSGKVTLWTSQGQRQRIDADVMLGYVRIASGVDDQVTARYPPNAKGIARILPWHWSVEPVVEPEAQGAIDKVLSIARTPKLSEMIALTDEDLALVQRLGVNPDDIARIGELREVLQSRGPKRDEWYVAVPSARALVQPKLIMVMTVLYLIVFPMTLIVFGYRRTRRSRRSRAEARSRSAIISQIALAQPLDDLSSLSGIAMALMGIAVFVAESHPEVVTLGVVGSVVAPYAVAMAMERQRWRHNPLVDVIYDIGVMPSE